MLQEKDSPIRVLLIPSSDYTGHPFPQRHNQIFDRLNNDDRFEVHVVRFGFYDKPKLRTDVTIHTLEEIKSKNLLFYYLSNAIDHAKQIIRIIKTESIDVIVLSNLSAPLVYTLMDKISPVGIPMIFDLPDYYPTSAAGYVFDTRKPLGRLTVGALDCALRHLIRHANAVTVVSHALLNYCAAVGVRNVRLVPNGISESFLTSHDGDAVRRDLGYDDQDLIIGYVGSIEFWLDFQTLLKGIALSREKGINAKLLLVGKGLRTDYHKKVSDWISKEGLKDSVTWLGFVPHDEVPEIMAGLDIGTIPFDVSNPTAYFSSPNKLWEYLSQKTPVMATPIPEILYHRNNVYLTSTPEDYVHSISSIAMTEQKPTARTEKGYSESLSQTWENSANAFEDVIHSVLNQKQL
jgi:glycosyltransferase involved in cell wall biosynthesis